MEVLQSEYGSFLVHNPEVNAVVSGSSNEVLVVNHIDGVCRVFLVLVNKFRVFINLSVCVNKDERLLSRK